MLQWRREVDCLERQANEHVPLLCRNLHSADSRYMQNCFQGPSPLLVQACNPATPHLQQQAKELRCGSQSLGVTHLLVPSRKALHLRGATNTVRGQVSSFAELECTQDQRNHRSANCRS